MTCVLLSLPILIPLLSIVALAVALTSAGPVFFLQTRTGLNGRTFKIIKFRTMIDRQEGAPCLVTTRSDNRFTPVGPFLRKWKLDELPQLINVLLGHMSLVGPRPKVPEHEPHGVNCRPGITGAASLAFAREELTLDQIPRSELNEFYNDVVLPAKREIDARYMARATFFTDMALIFNSLLGRWDRRMMEKTLRNHREQTERPIVSASGRRLPLSLRPIEVQSMEGDSVA